MLKYMTQRIINITNFDHGIGENNFMKLNINDIDATSEIFDPKSANGNFISPMGVNSTFGEILNSATRVYNSFTSGSSSKKLPREIGISVNGIPENLSSVFDLKSLKDWNISFQQDGITMTLNYADAPPRSPTMDYLQSRLHNQFHYVTIHGQ